MSEFKEMFIIHFLPKIVIGVGVIALIVVFGFLSGCSTTRALGETELLNEMGFEGAREAMSTYHKTANVLGIESNTRHNSTFNRAVGQVKNTNVDPDSVSDVPYVVRDLKELFRYFQ